MNLRKVISGCLAAVLVLTSVVRVSAATGFPDYDKNAWYAEAVSAAVENDLLRGANGRLNLQGDLTRGEMAAITNRAFGTYVKANISKFRDVPKDAWDYVVNRSAGIIIGDTAIDLNRAITDMDATLEAMDTVLLCFALFKTGSLSKSLFGAH